LQVFANVHFVRSKKLSLLFRKEATMILTNTTQNISATGLQCDDDFAAGASTLLVLSVSPQVMGGSMKKTSVVQELNQF
jgi:hypothetical protein